MPNGIEYDSKFIADLVPAKIRRYGSSGAVSVVEICSIPAGAANLRALEAKNQFNVGFQLRATRPLGGSGEDSDERIGFVANKTLYNGGLLDKELEGARAIFEANVAQIKDAYRESTVTIETALQNIESMDKAIVLALKMQSSLKTKLFIYDSSW